MCKTNQLAGRRAVRFDGVDDNLATPAFAWPQAFSAFAVIKSLDAVPSQDGFANVSLDATNRIFEWRSNTATTAAFYGFDTAGAAYAANNPLPTQTWRKLSFVRTVAAVEAWINVCRPGSTATAATTPALTAALYLGTGRLSNQRPGAVDIAELFAYDHAMTTADRQQVERYLTGKWG